MNQALACAACGRALAAADAVCICEETRTAAAAAAQSALDARAARGRIYVCPSCHGHFSRADLMARLFYPLRRRFGQPWPHLSCPHCATELRSRHARSLVFRIATLAWLAGLPLYLFAGLPPGLQQPAMLAGSFVLAAALAVQHWRESRDPHTYEALAPK